MTTEELCVEIVKRIAALCHGDEDLTIEFSNDWGPWSLTVVISDMGHTHVGLPEDVGGTFESMVEGLYNTLHGGPGLSFVK